MLCGIDIGGTKMAAGLTRPDGTVVDTLERTDHTSLDETALMNMAAAMVRQLCARANCAIPDVEGVAVGMAGHMRSRDGIVLTTSNLHGFKNYPLVKELSSRLGLRVQLENDANCQAWAEYKYGSGKGHDDCIFVTVSTGIGAGIIINGKLYRGKTGTAGEIGHTIIEPHNGLPCTCGNSGCFMAHASTVNLSKLARRESRRYGKSRILKRGDTDEEVDHIDGKHVYAHACAGDPAALAIIDEYAEYLGIMLYNLFQIFNPSAIILGGGLMNWELGFFERIREVFDRLATPMLHDPVTLAKAGVGQHSGVLGAAALLLEKD